MDVVMGGNEHAALSTCCAHAHNAMHCEIDAAMDFLKDCACCQGKHQRRGATQIFNITDVFRPSAATAHIGDIQPYA